MNVIVIVADTCRADHLGCYGNEWMHTESLDALAAQSMVFTSTYTASFPTIPHRCDCFTGRYGFPFYGWGPLPKDYPSLAEVLSRAGFVTQLIHDTPHLRRGTYDYDRGFSGSRWNRGQESDCEFTRANDTPAPECSPEKNRGESRAVINHASQRLDHPGEAGHHSMRTATDVCRWLEHNYRADRFFLWVDLFDPHEPWDPPQWYVDLYFPGGFEGEKVRNPRYGATDYLTEEELQWAHAAYCGELTLVDRAIGIMLRKVADMGLLEDTAIVFTSDHGFLHGEHGKIGKHTLDGEPWQLYEEIARVPLMIRLPDGPRDVHKDLLVQPVDLRPTILELCGVEDDTPLHGKSLGRVLDGHDVRLREMALSSGCVVDRSKLPSRLTITQEDGWSLIVGRSQDPIELYDLNNDPHQQHNVYEDNQFMALELLAMFRAFLMYVGAGDDVAAQWK